MAAKSPTLEEPLHGIALLFAGLMLALGNFLVVLDTTIANVSIPNIAGGLAISPQQGTWVITSYAVADAIVVPLSGWLALRFGPVKLMAGAMLMFGFWSAVCGLSHSLTMLVIARILQGASGAPMIPMSQSLLMRVFGPKRAGAATGIWAMTTLLAPIFGPILGGWLCDNLGWEWIFFVNVPIAGICALLLVRFLVPRDDLGVQVPVDSIGLGMLVIWVGSLQILLDKGKELDWLNSPFIISLAVIAAVVFVAFILWELTAPNPIVNLSVFKNRTFAFCCIVIGVAYGALFSSIVLMPLWMQTNLGYTATQSGLVSATVGISALFVAPVVARSIGKIDARLLICIGMCVSAGVMLWRTGSASNMTPWQITVPYIAQGLSMPMFFLPISALALSQFKGKMIADAAGLSSFVRTVSGAFGASIVTTQWETSSDSAKVTLASRLQNPQGFLNNIMAGGQSAGQARQQLDNIVNGQSVMLGTNHMFLVIAIIFVIAAIVIWLVPKPRQKIQAGAAH